MVWEADPGVPLIFDSPLVLEIQRADGVVVLRLIIPPSVTGGILSGIGIQ